MVVDELFFVVLLTNALLMVKNRNHYHAIRV